MHYTHNTTRKASGIYTFSSEEVTPLQSSNVHLGVVVERTSSTGSWDAGAQSCEELIISDGFNGNQAHLPFNIRTYE
jgi:hypothetical protein